MTRCSTSHNIIMIVQLIGIQPIKSGLGVIIYRNKINTLKFFEHITAPLQKVSYNSILMIIS